METHLLSFGNHLHGEGHEVSFLVTKAVGAWHERPAEAGIPVESVLQRRWESKIKHAQRVLGSLQGYDAVMLNHCPPARAVAGSIDRATAVVSMIHTDHPDDYPIALSPHGDIDRTICPSDRIYRTALAEGTRDESLVVVPYGVPFSTERPAGSPGASEAAGVRLVFVGRLVHAHKGVLNLPSIVARFAARHAGAFQLDVIGDGPDRQALQREIVRLQVGEVVNLVGDLSHEEVLARLSRYDALLMPSRFEGFGIVMLEAMAAGVVPVVSDLPGVTDEAVRDGVNGFLVAPDDLDGFANALENAAKPSANAELSQAARRTIRDRFSSDRILPRHEDVLVEAVEHRRDTMLPRSGVSSYELLGRGPRAPRVVVDAVKRGRKLRSSLIRPAREAADGTRGVQDLPGPRP